MFSHASATKPKDKHVSAALDMSGTSLGAIKTRKDLASSTPATVPLPPRPPGVTTAQ